MNNENLKKRGSPFIDFFAYTFKNISFDECTTKHEIASFLSMNLSYLLPFPIYNYMDQNNLLSYEISPNSGMGYRFRMFYPNVGVNIMADGVTSGHGIHVVLSGSILNKVSMNRDDFQNFYDFIDDRISYLCSSGLDFSDSLGFNWSFSNVSFLISRCDIAYDFEVNFLEFYDRVKEGKYSSSTNKLSFNIDSSNHGTIYFGSRSCPMFIRIYDKAKEIKDKMHNMLGIVYDDVPENYTRVEFEVKNHSRCNYSMLVFREFLSSSESVGNFCRKYLILFDDVSCSSEWDIYKSVILYNCSDYIIDYNRQYQTSINLSYLQNMANMIITYCHKIPGFLEFLKSNFNYSKSALNKCKNICLDFDTLYDSCLEVVNDEEKFLLEHLSFFDLLMKE